MESDKCRKDRLIKINNQYQYYENREEGRGSFGVIYRGLKDNKILIAVKKYLMFNNQESIESYNNELKIFRRIEYSDNNLKQNLLKFYGCYENTQRKQRYIFMELLRESMETRLKKGIKFTTHKVIKQILDATLFLHLNNIAHLDIKPDNLCFDEEDNCKMIDFSISRDFSAKMSAGGTPMYNAPQVYFKKDFDERSDIWSVGATIFKILTKMNIFRKDEKTISIQYITEFFRSMEKKQTKIKFDQVEQKYRNLLKKMLQYDITKRIRIEDVIFLLGLCEESQFKWVNKIQAIRQYLQFLMNRAQYLLILGQERFRGRTFLTFSNLEKYTLIMLSAAIFLSQTRRIANEYSTPNSLKSKFFEQSTLTSYERYKLSKMEQNIRNISKTNIQRIHLKLKEKIVPKIESYLEQNRYKGDLQSYFEQIDIPQVMKGLKERQVKGSLFYVKIYERLANHSRLFITEDELKAYNPYDQNTYHHMRYVPAFKQVMSAKEYQIFNFTELIQEPLKYKFKGWNKQKTYRTSSPNKTLI